MRRMILAWLGLADINRNLESLLNWRELHELAKGDEIRTLRSRIAGLEDEKKFLMELVKRRGGDIPSDPVVSRTGRVQMRDLQEAATRDAFITAMQERKDR